jgi:DoxX-like family
MPRRLARPALVALGLAEVVLAGWGISGRRPRDAALAETGLLALMNGGGFAFSRRHIPRPKTLLAENVAFLAAAWWAALSEE